MRSDAVISVDGLSKSYQIGLRERQNRTFREAFTDTLASPFRRLKSIAAGGNGSNAEEDTFWALKDVSFEVKRGEVVGIIGRNGAGKSTLLKVLSRITEPTSGQIRLRGRVASLLEVGTGFHPELTGRENIYLNGAILGMKRAEIARKFDEIVAFAEVEKFLDTPVKRYSSGMYVRLAFAVAAHLEPEILIVDEVLAVGDAEFQKKCLGKMKEVSEGGGRTVLFVSHNMAAIRALCSSAIVLQRGEIETQGDPISGTDAYLNGALREQHPSFLRSVDRCDEDYRVDYISVNGAERGTCDVTGTSTLEITVRGISQGPNAIDIEVWLTDSAGCPLGFGSAYHTRGGVVERQGGPYVLQSRFTLPSLNKGDYWLTLTMVDYRGQPREVMRAERCIRLASLGVPVGSLQVFDSSRNGAIFLFAEHVQNGRDLALTQSR